MPKPYIGVTGATTRAEVIETIKNFLQAGITLESTHQPMLGYLVSHKTLAGFQTENRRYPPVSQLPELLESGAHDAFTTIHYNTKEVTTLSSQIEALLAEVYDAGLCKGIQLNVKHLFAREVHRIKERFPKLDIIFQANEAFLAGKTEREVVDALREYVSALSYVLIDSSGGRGRDFDHVASSALGIRLREEFSSLRIGFAGGLSCDNVAERITSLSTALRNKEFCIDAESRLRDKVSEAYCDDLFNIEKTRQYISEASCGFGIAC